MYAWEKILFLLRKSTFRSMDETLRRSGQWLREVNSPRNASLVLCQLPLAMGCESSSHHFSPTAEAASRAEITKCIPPDAACFPAFLLTSHGPGYPIRAIFISINTNLFWRRKSLRYQVIFINIAFLSQSRGGTVKFWWIPLQPCEQTLQTANC